MDDKKFREYWENRTVADIMYDWGEQRDEWEDIAELMIEMTMLI